VGGDGAGEGGKEREGEHEGEECADGAKRGQGHEAGPRDFLWM